MGSFQPHPLPVPIAQCGAPASPVAWGGGGNLSRLLWDTGRRGRCPAPTAACSSASRVHFRFYVLTSLKSGVSHSQWRLASCVLRRWRWPVPATRSASVLCLWVTVWGDRSLPGSERALPLRTQRLDMLSIRGLVRLGIQTGMIHFPIESVSGRFSAKGQIVNISSPIMAI